MKALPKSERVALRRVFALPGVAKAPLAWAVVTGVAMLVCTVGLAAVSAWLVARASQTPLMAPLTLAATIVRTSGVSRPVFRYPRQLTNHSVALRGMLNLRSAVYSRLAGSRIDRMTRICYDDLLAHTGRDIDTVDDLAVHALLPITVAVSASVASVAVVVFFSPTVALTLAYCLTAAGLVGLYAPMHGARLAEIQQIEDRIELIALSFTMLESSGELRVSGRMDAFASALGGAERRVFANRDAAARPRALFSAIETLATGCAVLAALVIGRGEVAGGALIPVELTIVTLMPLATFEAIDPLGETAVQFV